MNARIGLSGNLCLLNCKIMKSNYAPCLASWSYSVEVDEGSFMPKWKAVVFMKLKNKRNCFWKTLTEWGLYSPSFPSTKELHGRVGILFVSPVQMISMVSSSNPVATGTKIKQKKSCQNLYIKFRVNFGPTVNIIKRGIGQVSSYSKKSKPNLTQ